MTSYGFIGRLVSGVVGIGTGSLGAMGAWEFAFKLEGMVSYLVIAAPVVAGTAALIPPIAEWMWKEKQRAKAVFWWVVLIPAAATVFFAAAERVHVAKAGAKAERSAYSKNAARAQSDLDALKVKADDAKAKSDKTQGWSNCGNSCKSIRATAARLETEVADAQKSLLVADKQTTAEATLVAPVWLLPLALDLITFMAIWTALSGLHDEEVPLAKKRRRYKRRKPKAPVTGLPSNVVPLRRTA